MTYGRLPIGPIPKTTFEPIEKIRVRIEEIKTERGDLALSEQRLAHALARAERAAVEAKSKAVFEGSEPGPELDADVEKITAELDAVAERQRHLSDALAAGEVALEETLQKNHGRFVAQADAQIELARDRAREFLALAVQATEEFLAAVGVREWLTPTRNGRRIYRVAPKRFLASVGGADAVPVLAMLRAALAAIDHREPNTPAVYYDPLQDDLDNAEPHNPEITVGG